jgi:nicotinate phosphoribosyltransferase
MSMVASKTARVVLAAGDKSVMEFGQRRTHPAAAIDATWAAWVAGVHATSNIAAFARWGITATGTMDHFAIQAAERPGLTRSESEQGFFHAYAKTFDAVPTTMLVDTYDTERGIRNAVSACPNGALGAIRIDSNVSRESVLRARALLAELGSPDTLIYVSDGLDEHRVAELRDVADGFGVGENAVCSPDAATGIGAVAKLVENGYGKTTMKVAHGTGKATLPGELQVWRFSDHDLITLAREAAPGGEGRPVLLPVWRGNSAVVSRSSADPKAALASARARAQHEISTLAPDFRSLDTTAHVRKLVASGALVREIERLVVEAAQ